MSYLFQSSVALAGMFFLGWGITQLADRRLWRIADALRIPSIFIMVGGLALMLEAYLQSGEFGIVGSVLVILSALTTASVHWSHEG
ncbi:MAG: hypothetical protein ACOYLB_04460 [Phototrophicaceae bacterium]